MGNCLCMIANSESSGRKKRNGPGKSEAASTKQPGQPQVKLGRNKRSNTAGKKDPPPADRDPLLLAQEMPCLESTAAVGNQTRAPQLRVASWNVKDLQTTQEKRLTTICDIIWQNKYIYATQ